MITNPTPQRALRGHRPKRLGSRTAVTGDHLARLVRRLTPRDRWLGQMLYEHRVLTTGQIADLAWPSTRAANLRLLQLYKWRVVDRFQPFLTYGSAPMHYVLDVAGATVIAREEGLETRELGYRHERAMGIAYSLQLAHTVGVNSFFTTLVACSRQADDQGRLTGWWSETRCRRHFGDLVRPDAYGRWREPAGEFEWFLEYDCGTERAPQRVAHKLADYAKLASTTGITTPVLVWTTNAHREARVRRALTEARAALNDPLCVPIATTTANFRSEAGLNDFSQARWLPLEATLQPSRRLRLIELTTAWPHLPPLTETEASTTSVGKPTGVLPTAPPPQPPHPHDIARGG
ncbi:replication-relaxation family protein [Streptomyces sp. CC224B]|uniref:replication-relaxation family protein n=1 Tax=Streptomyces sp. CC224B TaxID=3044571 RepID=UPI0024A9255B|nr:replication-relaxation family protein [Streptomyces sp. CC224B]